MAIWLIRGGSHGEYELKFIQDNRVYVTWDNLDVDLSKLTDRADLVAAMTQRYPNAKPQGNPELGQPSVAIRSRNPKW